MKRINKFFVLIVFVLLSFGSQRLWADLYDDFNQYCLQNFGAEIPDARELVYPKFGQNLYFLPTGDWIRESQNSVAIGFETNLPSSSTVRYGISSVNENSTPGPDRYYYLHLHYLKNLQPNTNYMYQLVATDERGQQITRNGTFQTGSFPNAVYIPGNMGSPPYLLNQPDTTYIVTQDIVAQTRAFSIQADGVTLDLNGHTVTYDNGTPLVQNVGWDRYVYYDDSTFGVYVGLWNRPTGVKIYNGTIKQGANNGAGTIQYGFNPIYNCTGEVEIAGITADYSGDSVGGIITHWGTSYVHHNVVVDRGSVIDNRHQAIRAIVGSGPNPIHHNLVKRCRQIAIVYEGPYDSNELYIDSYATNAFGIVPYPGFEVSNNKIFGTGYHVNAIGWNTQINIHDNYIHLQGEVPNNRSDEYGAMSSVNGIRLTQYGGSFVPYENNIYTGNVLLIKGRNGTSTMRGVQFFSDPYVKNLVFSDNVVKVMVDDAQTSNAACVVAQGLPDRVPLQLPILYQNNRFISNICNIRFMDDYGGGGNHDFKGCTLVREGNDSRYRTLINGFWYWDSYNNDFIDTTVEGGASLGNYEFIGTGRRDFSVGHSLYVRAQNPQGQPLANQTIEVHDFTGMPFTGRTNADGVAKLELMDYTMLADRNQANPTRILRSGHFARIPSYCPVAITASILAERRDASNPYPLTFAPLGSMSGPVIVAVNGQLQNGYRIDVIGINFGAAAGHVTIGAQPVRGGGGEIEQSLVSWSDEVVRFTMNQGSFATNQTVYLFVVDAGGQSNAAGFPIVIGSGYSDNNAPVILNASPANGQVSVPLITSIQLEVTDSLPGVDPSTIRLAVNGLDVIPVINPSPYGYYVDYQPTSPLAYNQTVPVRTSMSDLAGNAMTQTISFKTIKRPAYPGILWDAVQRTGSTRWIDSEYESSVRILLESAHITGSAGQVVLEFQGRSDGRDAKIRGVSIAVADLTGGQLGYVDDNTWTQVTFDGHSTLTWGSDVVTIPAGDTKVSDVINFTIDPAKSYYVTLKIVTPSVYLGVPSDFGELYYYNEDRSGQLDWGDAGYGNDYHAFSRLYGIGVNPVNHAPIVNAGPPQVITLPQTAKLNGSATDDQLPNGSLSFTWSQSSGPSTATIDNPQALTTIVHFPAEGTYVFTLTADDSLLNARSDVTITVRPSGSANNPPTVEAGPNQTISFGNSAALDGIVTDDGVPGPVTVQWRKVTGPGIVTFDSSTTIHTTAQFSAAGAYTLRLTAFDGELTVSDEVTITVNTRPSGAISPDLGPQRNVIHPSIGSEAILSFTCDKATNVEINIYNRQGRVKGPLQGECAVGTNSFSWDGRNEDGEEVASGIYLVKINDGKTITTIKVAVVR
ncbi:MAG: hypothetical protein LHV69_03600 [Elusimicrobia bacterium]|nr:hypothetical protein [Candidatus Obscuribacterium magneticum]